MIMMSSAKRPRTSSFSSDELLIDVTGAPVTVRSEDLWFEDGSVVLRAEETLFRVHRTILARVSPALNDILNAPRHSNEKTIDGCPTIHLSDSEKDLRHFLAVLYNPVYNPTLSQPFPSLEAMIRLGHKYRALEIRRAAMESILATYPSSLDWRVETISRCSRIDYYPALPLDIFNLAYEHRLQSVLPGIYFELSKTFTLDELVDGITRPDNSTSSIPNQCIIPYAKGLDSLRNAEKDVFKWLAELPSSSCGRRNWCMKGIHQLFAQFFYGVEAPNGLARWNSEWGRYICESCASTAKGAHEVGRRELWDQLPELFGLPRWEELTNFS